MNHKNSVTKEKILVGILTRNEPEKADELYNFFLNNNYKNIFVLENGSNQNNLSKNYSKRIIPTKGVAWGVNYICRVFQKTNCKYLWLNFNDVRFTNFEASEKWILEKLINKKNGILVPNWVIWSLYKNRYKDLMIYNFDPITFIITKECLNKISTTPKCNPLYDSKNFANHYNTMLTSEAAIEKNFFIVSNDVFKIYEKFIPAERSLGSRGYDEKEWINDIGIRYLKEFIFRNYSWSLKKNHKVFRRLQLSKIRLLLAKKIYLNEIFSMSKFMLFIRSYLSFIKNKLQSDIYK